MATASAPTSTPTGLGKPGTRPTQTETKLLMEQGRCFHCRQTGHSVRNCPLRTRVNEVDANSNTRGHERVIAALDHHFGPAPATTAKSVSFAGAAAPSSSSNRVVELDNSDSSEN